MVRAGAPNMLPWVMRDGRVAYVNPRALANGASADGVPVLHFPGGDLLLLETMTPAAAITTPMTVRTGGRRPSRVDERCALNWRARRRRRL